MSRRLPSLLTLDVAIDGDYAFLVGATTDDFFAGRVLVETFLRRDLLNDWMRSAWAHRLPGRFFYGEWEKHVARLAPELAAARPTEAILLDTAVSVVDLMMLFGLCQDCAAGLMHAIDTGGPMRMRCGIRDAVPAIVLGWRGLEAILVSAWSVKAAIEMHERLKTTPRAGVLLAVPPGAAVH